MNARIEGRRRVQRELALGVDAAARLEVDLRVEHQLRQIALRRHAHGGRLEERQLLRFVRQKGGDRLRRGPRHVDLGLDVLALHLGVGVQLDVADAPVEAGFEAHLALGHAALRRRHVHVEARVPRERLRQRRPRVDPHRPDVDDHTLPIDAHRPHHVRQLRVDVGWRRDGPARRDVIDLDPIQRHLRRHRVGRRRLGVAEEERLGDGGRAVGPAIEAHVHAIDVDQRHGHADLAAAEERALDDGDHVGVGPQPLDARHLRALRIARRRRADGQAPQAEPVDLADGNRPLERGPQHLVGDGPHHAPRRREIEVDGHRDDQGAREDDRQAHDGAHGPEDTPEPARPGRGPRRQNRQVCGGRDHDGSLPYQAKVRPSLRGQQNGGP
ncbi:MAG: hypothetical protein QM820_10960 [Minicystis sp.]